MLKKLNYKYIIVISGFLMTFVFLGLGNATLSLYLKPVTEQFGFSRGGFALIFSIISLVSMLTGLSFSFFVKKIGVRLVIAMGGLLEAIAFFVFYQASTLPVFYLGATLLGMGIAFTSTLAVSYLVNNWFDEKQGTMLGIVFAGTGLGAAVFSVVIGNYIVNNGASSAFLLSSIIIAVMIIPIVFFIKSGPENTVEESVHEENAHEKKDGDSIGMFIKKPGVALGLFTLFLLGSLIFPLRTITPAILGDRGFDPMFASTIFGSMFIILTVAQIGIGWINDRFGIKAAMGLGVGCFIASASLLLFMNTELTATIYVIVYGISFTTITVMIPLFASAVVGKEDLNKYLVLFMACMTLGTMLGTPLVSVAYDKLGSYDQIIAVYIALGIVALVLSMISLRKSTMLSPVSEVIN